MSTVELEVFEQGKVALVRLNRPNALNAVNAQLAQDLAKVVHQLDGDEKVRAVILTGKGRAFCAGGDLAEFKAAADPKQFIHDLAGNVHKSVMRIRGMNAPWIVSINGPCFGVGLSLACCCDLRIASTEAKFSVGFTGVGLSPDSSLLYFLPKIVGLTKATEMTLLNKAFPAEEAFQIGLVSRVIEPNKMEEETLEMAKKFARMPTLALGMDKRMLDASFCHTLEEHLALELECVSESAGTADFQEGCAAFSERRKPDFKGG